MARPPACASRCRSAGAAPLLSARHWGRCRPGFSPREPAGTEADGKFDCGQACPAPIGPIGVPSAFRWRSVLHPALVARVPGEDRRLDQAGAAAAAAAFVLAMFVGRVFGSLLARHRCSGTVARRAARSHAYWFFDLLELQPAFLYSDFRDSSSWGWACPFSSADCRACDRGRGCRERYSKRQGNDCFRHRASVTPVLLGSLADRIGLRSAHWLVPILIGGLFQRWSLPVRCSDHRTAPTRHDRISLSAYSLAFERDEAGRSGTAPAGIRTSPPGIHL